MTHRKVPLPVTIFLSIVASIVILALLGLGVVYGHDSLMSRSFEAKPKFVQDNNIGPVTITPDLKENIPIKPEKAKITPECKQELAKDSVFGKTFSAKFDWNQTDSGFYNSLIRLSTNGHCWLASSGKLQLRVVYKIRNDTWYKKFGIPRDVITYRVGGKIYYPTTYEVQPGTSLKPGQELSEDVSNFQIPYSARNGTVYLKWGDYLKVLSY